MASLLWPEWYLHNQTQKLNWIWIIFHGIVKLSNFINSFFKGWPCWQCSHWLCEVTSLQLFTSSNLLNVTKCWSPFFLYPLIVWLAWNFLETFECHQMLIFIIFHKVHSVSHDLHFRQQLHFPLNNFYIPPSKGIDRNSPTLLKFLKYTIFWQYFVNIV